MPRMGKTEEDWLNGLKLGFLKTVQPNSFPKFDWGWVIGKSKQNELDCRDTAPLTSSSDVISGTIAKVFQIWLTQAGYEEFAW